MEAVTEQMRVFRAQLPVLLKRLEGIPDPRDPKKTKHKLTVMMIYLFLFFSIQLFRKR